MRRELRVPTSTVAPIFAPTKFDNRLVVGSENRSLHRAPPPAFSFFSVFFFARHPCCRGNEASSVRFRKKSSKAYDLLLVRGASESKQQQQQRRLPPRLPPRLPRLARTLSFQTVFFSTDDVFRVPASASIDPDASSSTNLPPKCILNTS